MCIRDSTSTPGGPKGPAMASTSQEAPREETLQQRKQEVKAALGSLPDQLVASAEPEQPPGGVTPSLSAIPAPGAPGGLVPFGKRTAEKIHIGGWPNIKGFIPWKLAFLKAVAAASITPDEAFIWII